MKLLTPDAGFIPVVTRHVGSVRTVTRAGQSNPRPAGYMKTFVPLKKAKFGAVHATARSTASARYWNDRQTTAACSALETRQGARESRGHCSPPGRTSRRPADVGLPQRNPQ